MTCKKNVEWLDFSSHLKSLWISFEENIQVFGELVQLKMESSKVS